MYVQNFKFLPSGYITKLPNKNVDKFFIQSRVKLHVAPPAALHCAEVNKYHFLSVFGSKKNVLMTCY